jgi:pimeloyl-ACP methyl ester carboxylesterase
MTLASLRTASSLLLLAIAAAGCSSSDATGDAGGGATATALAAPTADGPYSFDQLEERPTLAGEPEIVHCVVPTSGPGAGPFPLVLLEHGFGEANVVMAPYAERLATHGFVACEVDFPNGLAGVDNTKQAAILVAGIDWVADQGKAPGSKLEGRVDATRVGATGHSLGGKLSLLLAMKDPRVVAAIELDPVDGGGPTDCKEPACVDVSAKMGSLAIPTGFLGETTDATTSGFQACAPAADNYATFYAGARSPSFEVTVKGANHLSFVGQQAGAGACNLATTPTDAVMDLSLAYVTAFHERHLRGLAEADAYLVGAEAKKRWIDAGLATLVTK